MGINPKTIKTKEAKMAKLTKLQQVQKKMEELNSNPINPGLEKMVDFIRKNGPTSVETLANHFEVVDTKAIRRPFQKAGLKKGNYAIELPNGDILTLDQRSKKNIYSIQK